MSFLRYVSELFTVAYSTHPRPGYSPILWRIGQVLLYILFPFAWAYVFFHILIVTPMTYIPIVLVSAALHRIEYSGMEVEIETKSEEGTSKVLISNIIRRDALAAKGFLIGVPALVLSTYSALSVLFVSWYI